MSSPYANTSAVGILGLQAGEDVKLTSLMASFFIPFMLAMLTRSLWFFGLVPPLLLVAYAVCLKDVYLFEIARAVGHLKPCRNARIWGCRSHAPR